MVSDHPNKFGGNMHCGSLDIRVLVVHVISHDCITKGSYDLMHKISLDVIEITKSLEFTQSTLDEELQTVENNIKKFVSDLKELENNILNPNEVSEKLIELEDRSQRNNIRIDGLKENTNENWDDC